MKGVPKRDGSGQGQRKNRGRGGCQPPTGKNQRNSPFPNRKRNRRKK